jgi:hypothetical protein
MALDQSSFKIKAIFDLIVNVIKNTTTAHNVLE